MTSRVLTSKFHVEAKKQGHQLGRWGQCPRSYAKELCAISLQHLGGCIGMWMDARCV